MNMNDQVSRRRILQALGLGGAGLALAACGGATGNAAQAQQTAKLSSTKFDIPDAAPDFPSGPVTVRWVDSGDQKAVFFDAFFPALEKKFPNVKVDYNGTSWNTIQDEIVLGLHNGTEPNVFQLPPAVTPGEAVNNGWLAALDDFVPNWPKIKSFFPLGTFAPGTTDFNGKTYGYPWTSNQRIGSGTLYNTDYVKAAGYDPTKILSWTEFRDACRKITKAGQGKYYGLILGMGQPGETGPAWIDPLAEMAGAHGNEFNWKTGTFNFTTDIYQEATELFFSLQSDKSIFPDSISITAPTARGDFPNGVAGFILQGGWNIPEWQQSNPGFKFGFNLPPQKDPKNFWPLSYGPGGSNTWFVGSNSTKEQLAVIGEVFRYVGTAKGQIEWADFDGCGDPPQDKQAVTYSHMGSIQKLALKLGYEYTVLAPNPELKNPAYDTYQELYVTPEPDWDQTLIQKYSGQISLSIRAMLKKVQDAYEKAMDDAIAATRAKGLSISRDDWVFSNWNPRVAYPYPKASGS